MFRLINIKKILFLTEAYKDNRLYLIFIGLSISAILEAFSISLIFPIFASIVDNNFLNKIPIGAEIVKLFLPNSWMDENYVLTISPIQILLGSGLLLLSLFILKFFLLLSIYSKLENLSRNIKNKMSMEFYKKYFELPYTLHYKLKTSEITNNLMRSYDIPSSLLPISIIFIESITFIFISAILFFTDLYSALLLFVLFPMITLMITEYNKTRLVKWSKEKHNINYQRLKSINDLFRSIKDVKITQNFTKFFQNYDESTRAHTSIIKKEKILNFYPRYILEILFLLTILLVFYFLLKNSGEVIDVIPKLSLFTIAGLRLIPSVNKIVSNFNTLKNISHIVDIFYNFSKKVKNIELRKKNKSIFFEPNSFNELKLENLSYTYPDKKIPVLNNINLKIKKNETIGIIGESGVGKSTLLDLITGLIEVKKGKITINDFLQDDIKNLSDLIGYVPQDVNLISESVRENIAFGISKEKIKEELLDQAIERANLKKFINNLPEGIFSNLGESGKLISGGERQRIGIARALYSKPKILLLDEATSSLDSETAKKIIEDLLSLSNEITIILVTHNKQNLIGFSKIYELKKELIKLK